MQAHAHLRLIVSEPPVEADEEPIQQRFSMIQPVSAARLRWHWLRMHRNVLAMWVASAGLLTLAALLTLGWL